MRPTSRTTPTSAPPAASTATAGRDLWGGFADLAGGRPWDEDTTIQIVFSATKGITAACVHLLVERRELDLDEPVAAYWPEFATRGKDRIPLRWVLCHRAGLAVVEGDLTLPQVLAWDPVVAAVYPSLG